MIVSLSVCAVLILFGPFVVFAASKGVQGTHMFRLAIPMTMFFAKPDVSPVARYIFELFLLIFQHAYSS